MAPTLLVQLTDLHVRVGPGDGVAAKRLESAVRAVLALRPQPDAVVITGDLVEHGSAAEYARVRELLVPLELPLHVLPGNHDDRATLRSTFGLAGDEREPVRYSAPCGELRLVVCDSTRPERDDGHLGSEDLAWLEAELAAAPGEPTVLAIHHPPLRTGIQPLDDIGMTAESREALGGIVAKAPQVQRIVAGHVHRGAFGLLGACVVFACPSTYLQGKLAIGDGPLELVWEPPAFGLHVLLDGELVSHVAAVA